MRKFLFKRFAALIAMSVVFSVISIYAASAAAPDTVSVRLRIEGISKNIYDGEVSVPKPEGGRLTVKDVLLHFGETNSSVSIAGVDIDYITEINGEASGAFGGWDGWMFLVDGKSPSEGINNVEISNGGEIVLYYGDPFGPLGFQYPQLDKSGLKEGILRFYSEDTVYDESWNPSVQKNPVTGAKVTWGNAEYTTDGDGKVMVEEKHLTKGDHSVKIEKYSEDGLPLLLRFAPGFNVTVEGSGNEGGESGGPLDWINDNAVLVIIISSAVAAVLLLLIFMMKRRKK